MVFKKNVSSHTDVVGEAAEILQSVHVVVVLDDILYSSVAVLSCAVSIPPLLEDCSEQKTFKDVARRRLR